MRTRARHDDHLRRARCPRLNARVAREWTCFLQPTGQYESVQSQSRLVVDESRTDPRCAAAPSCYENRNASWTRRAPRSGDGAVGQHDTGSSKAAAVRNAPSRASVSARSRCVEGSGAEYPLSWKHGPALESSLGPRSSPEGATIASSKDLRCCYRHLVRPACGGGGGRLPGQSAASPARAADAPRSALRCHDCACVILLSAAPSKERVRCLRST